MISENTFRKEWITAQKDIDPRHHPVIERVVYAFQLLELLCKQDLDFVFKGGSSLLLHFQELHRFSTDIDILFSPDQFPKLQQFINEFNDSHFVTVSEDIRKPSRLQKKHFKFYYRSQFLTESAPLSYVLLDVVMDTNPFRNIQRKPIKLPLLCLDEPLSYVKVPSVDEMLGDKLTAFAPTTIGILYTDLKTTEIIKQLYDCSRLFRRFEDFDKVIQTNKEISTREIQYRELKDTQIINCLDDTMDACKVLLSNGNYGNPNHFELLKKGVLGFSNFVTETFTLYEAINCAMDVYVCCVMIMAGSEEKYNTYLEGFSPEHTIAPFLNRSNIKMLKILSGQNYHHFLEAVWVENVLKPYLMK